MAKATSNVVGGAAREGRNVSGAARRALRDAIDGLSPHDDDPRIAAHVRQLTATASPDDFEEREQAVAKAMQSSARIAKNEDLHPAVREKAAAAHLELQRAHLSKHSAGYGAWEQAAREAGRID